jgi:hypothetical protein
MTSDPDTSAAKDEPARAEVRLRMKPSIAARGYVDGAWWPRSNDPMAEFPGLVLAMSSWVGPVSRVAYNADDWQRPGARLTVEGWTVKLAGSSAMDPHTVVVTGPNQRRMSLLVVPADTPAGIARAVLGRAAEPDNVASVEDILTSNGVRLAERAAPTW